MSVSDRLLKSEHETEQFFQRDSAQGGQRYNYNMYMHNIHIQSRQSRFVEEYAIDHNGAGAAVRAGYAPKSAHVTASRLLRKANVADAVRVLEVETETELRVTRSRVISELHNAIELARVRNDVSAMISGWREIAKLCGYYAPQMRAVSLTASGSLLLRQLQDLPDSALVEMADADRP
jgi:phage terminase small subunit